MILSRGVMHLHGFLASAQHAPSDNRRLAYQPSGYIGHSRAAELYLPRERSATHLPPNKAKYRRDESLETAARIAQPDLLYVHPSDVA